MGACNAAKRRPANLQLGSMCSYIRCTTCAPSIWLRLTCCWPHFTLPNSHVLIHHSYTVGQVHKVLDSPLYEVHWVWSGGSPESKLQNMRDAMRWVAGSGGRAGAYLPACCPWAQAGLLPLCPPKPHYCVPYCTPLCETDATSGPFATGTWTALSTTGSSRTGRKPRGHRHSCC